MVSIGDVLQRLRPAGGSTFLCASHAAGYSGRSRDCGCEKLTRSRRGMRRTDRSVDRLRCAQHMCDFLLGSDNARFCDTVKLPSIDLANVRTTSSTDATDNTEATPTAVADSSRARKSPDVRVSNDVPVWGVWWWWWWWWGGKEVGKERRYAWFRFFGDRRLRDVGRTRKRYPAGSWET